ncbi:YybH family protein [Geminicoccus flavidas]|uniref:YybH family protein n=1 Tax=Geminicoccus flavidas TaxID=2506407 RepID=UPI00135B62FD|nr:nuclear transport factor 2 family protein [Geminicoccus flavidas]
MKGSGRIIGTLAACLLLLGCTARGPDPQEAGQAVRAALEQWRADFNAGRTAKVCDLFAPDLRYVYGGEPERGHAELCAGLQRALREPERRLAYDLAIQEIIVAGDFAVVRLEWTLHVSQAATGEPVATSTERGMDLFRRQADGHWRIVRFLAFDG